MAEIRSIEGGKKNKPASRSLELCECGLPPVSPRCIAGTGGAMLTAKPYVALIAIIAICALTGGAFVKGIGIGRKSEAARWQAELIESQQKAAKQAEAARATIAALEATKH